MNFKDGTPIYMQIAERLSDEILAGRYAPDERVPGVREYSALLEVNVNTTVKAYDLLSGRGILYTRRGLGYFVTVDAPDLIHSERRNRFFADDLPELFARMRSLGITAEDVAERWKKWLAEATIPPVL